MDSLDTRIDQVFTMLSNEYRREILVRLHEPHEAEPVTVTPTDLQCGDATIEEVTTRLYHDHLPRLADAGYIEWNRDDLDIWRGPRFAEMSQVLDLLQEETDIQLGLEQR